MVNPISIVLLCKALSSVQLQNQSFFLAIYWIKMTFLSFVVLQQLQLPPFYHKCIYFFISHRIRIKNFMSSRVDFEAVLYLFIINIFIDENERDSFPFLHLNMIFIIILLVTFLSLLYKNALFFFKYKGSLEIKISLKLYLFYSKVFKDFLIIVIVLLSFLLKNYFCRSKLLIKTLEPVISLNFRFKWWFDLY